MFNQNKKAQIFVIDFFIALFIFSVLLISIMFSWNNYNSKINEKIEYDLLINKAFQISNSLVRSSGFPPGWTEENVQIIGLASEDRVLSQSKIDSFAEFPLNTTAKEFKTYDYTFYFILKDINGNKIVDYGTNMTNAKKSATIRRYVVYNDEKATIEITLWR